jgi:CDGSH-type Zn-finger protein
MSEKSQDLSQSQERFNALYRDRRLCRCAGNVLETRTDFKLCGCGRSKEKPFCDGSHKGVDGELEIHGLDRFSRKISPLVFQTLALGPSLVVIRVGKRGIVARSNYLFERCREGDYTWFRLQLASTGARKVRLHPTKEELIKYCRWFCWILLTLDEITSENVLDISGISRGSLYHHFEDFSELLELAQVRRFASYVNKSIGGALTDLFWRLQYPRGVNCSGCVIPLQRPFKPQNWQRFG